MSVEFQVRQHDFKSGVQVIEILVDGEMVAILYPEGEKGVKLVSAHMEEVVEDDGTESIPPIPAIWVRFNPRPYTIEHGKLVRK